jgi:signal transduction histidine kinase
MSLLARPVVRDLLLAGVLFALAMTQAILEGAGLERLVALVLITGSVAIRRRHSLAAVTISWLTLLVSEGGLGGDVTDRGYAAVIALMVTVYSVAAYAPIRRAQIGLAIALLSVWGTIPFTSSEPLVDAAFTGLITAAPWAAGRIIRQRQHQIAELARLNLLIEQERDAHTREAVHAERDRMAREIHDVLTHSLTVMVVQLGAVSAAATVDPARTRQMVDEARGTGKKALSELRWLLHLNRSDDAPSVGATPGLRGIPELVQSMRALGLEVTYELHGEETGLPLATELAAFRVVQEALTNTLKHAPGAVARIDVRVEPGQVVVDVSDDGGDSDVAAAGRGRDSRPGYGIIGLRERASTLGGSIDAGPRAGGGFGVRATLPIVDAYEPEQR